MEAALGIVLPWAAPPPLGITKLQLTATWAQGKFTSGCFS